MQYVFFVNEGRGAGWSYRIQKYLPFLMQRQTAIKIITKMITAMNTMAITIPATAPALSPGGSESVGSAIEE